MIPREVRLSKSPLPVNTTTTTSAITNTTTMASSMPTAMEVISPSSRVETITSTA